MSLTTPQTEPAPAATATAGQVRGFGALARELSGLDARLTAYNVAYLALAWVLALGTIALVDLFPAWYVVIPAFLLISSRQQALLNCEHEAAHRKLLPSRRANDAVGRWLCAAAVGSPYGAAVSRHLTHHRLLATGQDPDRELHNAEPPRDSVTGMVRWLGSALLGAYAIMIFFGPGGDAPPSRTPRRDLISVVVVQALLAAGLTLAFGWWAWPLFWLAPLASVTTFCHLLRSFSEHAISDREQGDHANRLITIASNPLERGLVAPYSMNLHAAHHIAPSVPAPRLAELQRRLAGREDLPPLLHRRSYAAAMRGYLRSLRTARG